MNTQLITRIAVAAVTAALLAGCGSDDDKPAASTQTYKDHAGSYQKAYVSNGRAMLARLGISKTAATLVLTNDLEQSQHYQIDESAITDSEQFTFASGKQCTSSQNELTCSIDGQRIVLAEAASNTPSLDELKGEYQLLSNAEVIDISVDDKGAFLSELDGCIITGELRITAGSILAEQTGNTCSDAVLTGIAYNDLEYSAPQSLEVYIANSPLTGDWIKR